MGTLTMSRVLLALTLVVLSRGASMRRRSDVSYLQFPPARPFSRAAVETSLQEEELGQRPAALRDLPGAGQMEEYGSKRLPLRAAVESVPPTYLRMSAPEKRLPLRDAVERRPPAYDDDLFALTDELESLGIDPWAPDNKPVQPPPDKYSVEGNTNDETPVTPGHYVIQLPAVARPAFSQLGGPRMQYYGAAQPYNADYAWTHHYAAYEPKNRRSMDHYRVDNSYQQLVLPHHLGGQVSQYTDLKDLLPSFYGRDLSPSTTMAPASMKRVVCYIQGWSVYRRAPFAFSSASLPPTCTHVVYAYASLDPHSFVPVPSDHEYDIVQGGYRMVTGLKRQQPDLKVLISLGGSRGAGASRISTMAASPALRRAFALAARDFCKQYGFDGVDLNWEYPGAEEFGGTPEDKQNLVDLLMEMKTTFELESLLVTIAVPASRYRIEDGYSVGEVSDLVEWVTLKGWDMRPDSEECAVARHPSPLMADPQHSLPPNSFYTIDYAVRYWLRHGLSRSKLVLGVPLWGRSFRLENGTNSAEGARAAGPGSPGPYTTTPGMMAYFEVCEAKESGDWKKAKPTPGSGPSLVKEDQWVGYDDVDSVTAKMVYVREMGLGGGAAWAADMDDFRGLCGTPWPLLTAMSNTLRELPVPLPVSSSSLRVGTCNSGEDGLSSDPSNCAAYYLCRDGQRFHLACHEGTLYEPSTSLCKVMDPALCNPGKMKLGLFEEENPLSTMKHNDMSQEYYQVKQAPSKDEKMVVCYMTNWSFYRKGDGKFVPEHVDPRLCTDVVYAFASLDPDKLILKEFDPWTDIDNNLYARVASLSDTRVYLAMGGWTDSAGDKYSRLVSSPAARKAFATQAAAFLRAHGFQGLHLDWNYPKCWQSNCAKGPNSDKPNFAKLVKELSTEFKRSNPPLRLGVSLSGYKEVIDAAYDLPEIGRYANFMSVMSYDYHGGWEPEVSHGSPLKARPGDRYPQYTTEYVIKYLISQGAPRDKLLMGLAFYGQTFQLGDSSLRASTGPGAAAVGPGTAGDLTRQPGMLAYYEICARVKNLRWQTGRQEGAGPYAYNRDQWVGYEDVASITEKVNFANDQDLLGVMAWTIDLDDFTNVCCGGPFPLLRAAGRALGLKVPGPPAAACQRPPPPATPPPPPLTTTFESGAASPTTTPWTDTSSSTIWWTTQRPPATTTQRVTTTTTQRTTTTTARTTTTTRATTRPTRWTSTAPTTPAIPSEPQPTKEPCVTGTYSTDPGSCTTYRRCDGGVQRRQECAPGLHWNAAAMLCDWPSSAKCKPSAFSPPTESPLVTQRPFITQTTRRTMAPPATTPAIQITAAPTKKPTRKPTRKPNRKPTRKPTRAPHKSCVNGAYSTHSECDMFNICVNGVMVSQACAPGEAWNQAQTQCEPEGNVRCGAVKGPTRAPSKGRFPTRKPVSSPLQKAAAPLHAPCRAGEFSAYPGDCQQYQQCLWGKLEAFQCASGLHWNRERNICDWPSNANCNESPEVGVPDVDIPEILDNGSTESPAWSTTTTRRPWIDPTWPAWTPEPSTTVKTTTEKYVPSTLSGHYKIVCYFTNWAWYRRGLGKYVPEDIDANLCTHVVYGFAVLDSENLIIKAHDSWADFDNRFYERVTAYKRKGVKVSLALGGWNDSAGDKYSRLVNSAAARARFINHALGFLEKHNFDGLDLDWEYPKCWQTDCSKGPDSDKSAFSALVHELSVAFKPRGLLLSSAVSASKTVIDGGYDVPSLARDMDWIAVMAYDFHGQWDKKTGHVAPLYYHPKDDVSFFNANYSMHYWMAQGAPSRKLVMGMPLYGQSFTLGTSWDTPPELVAMKDERGLNVPARAGGQAGEYTRAAGFLAYYEICDRIKNRQWKVVQDEKGRMGPHAYKDDQWVSFDDRAMIKKKSQYVKSLNLGGAMVWALDLDDFKNSCGEGYHPLLTAIRDVLEDKSGVMEEFEPMPEVEVPQPVIPDQEVTGMVPGEGQEPAEPEGQEPGEPEGQEPVESEDQKPEDQEPGGIYPVEAVEAELVDETDQDIEQKPDEEPEGEPVYDEEEGYKMVCYFTNWAWYRQGVGKYLPSDIDDSLCTHIIYGFAVLDTQNLIIKPHDSWADIDNKFYEKVTALRAKGKKVLLALGGWNDSAGDKYSRLVNSPSARRRFVIQALDFVVSNNFDGLDLDWEYPVCWQVECNKGPASDKQGFSALVQELRRAFTPKKLLLSAAVSPNRKVIDAGYDVPILSENLDWIAVMTYDYHGQWDKKTGHVAPMYEHPDDADKFFNANATIHHWIARGASRSKLVMGLSLYGQSFSLATGTMNAIAGLNSPTYGGGEAGDFTRARGFLAYYEICERIQKQNWQVVRDPRGRMGPYAYKGDQWVSFDDIAMVRHKTSYMKAMGLGGGMVWALDLDDFRGLCGCEKSPLLSAAARELGLITTPQPRCQLESATPINTTPRPVAVSTQRPVIGVSTQKPIYISTQRPVYPPQPVVPMNEICEGNVFAPDPQDCNKYYWCNQGQMQSMSCPASLHWNKDRCDWPSNSNCQPSGPPSSPATIWPTQPAPVTVAPTRPPATKPPPDTSVGRPADFKVVCYFTNWAWYRKGDGKYSPADIDSSLCTHIAYGFAVLDVNKLTIMPHDSWADIDNDFYGQVTALKAKGIKVVIAIGGWNDSLGGKYSKLVNSPAARARFVTNVVQFVEQWHFDGLDLDWEYPKCWQADCDTGPASDKEAFAALVHELRVAFTPRGLLLSAAVSASKAVIDVAYNVPSLARDLDWIAVMTYDYHGHWDRMTGHVAPLYYYPGDKYDYFNANFSMNYWMQSGAPASKLVLGVPMYGQSFTLANSAERGLNAVTVGPGDAGEFTGAPGFLAYYEICDRVKRAGWSVDRDPQNRVGPWARRGTQWASFDDTKMVARKATLARNLRLGGAMIWALDLDDFKDKCGCGRHPLLKAINAALQAKPIQPCEL